MGSVDVVTKSVTHLTFSTAGGAGLVASRLSKALIAEGWNSQVASALDSDLKTKPLALPSHTIAAAVDNYVIKSSTWPSLISLERDEMTHKVARQQNSGVLHLHWVNGVLPLDRFSENGNGRIVWTLHDMNPFTGTCHHSFECKGYQGECSGCPAVRKPFQQLVSLHLRDKTRAVQTLENLRVVCPSDWLASRAMHSTVMKNCSISTILNPIDQIFFDVPITHKEERRTGRFVLVAAQLDDPIKDVALAIEGFSALHAQEPDAQLTLVGSGGHRFSAVPGVRLTGPLAPRELIDVLDTSDALIVSSQAENSPSVAYEAASRGVVPVVRKAGGLPEVVESLSEGVTFDNAATLTEALRSFMTKPVTGRQRERLIRKANALVDPATVAQSYIKLYGAA